MATHPDKLHLAIIPDGNRRWARKRGLVPWLGHKQAMENFRSIVEWCRQHPRIHYLTIWGFSTENWNRDAAEIKHLMRIFEDYLVRERPTFVKNATRLVHSGRTDRLPHTLVELIHDISEETKHLLGFAFHLALDYGGRDEILRAVRRAGLDNLSDEESLRLFLDQPSLPDIDLIIRTSGEQRTSNFFLWQSTYAEWFFNHKYFPDLTTDDIAQTLTEFDTRQRRFGG